MKCDNLLEKRHVWWPFQLDVSKIYGSFRQDFQRNPFSYLFQGSKSRIPISLLQRGTKEKSFFPTSFTNYISLFKGCLSSGNSGTSLRSLSLIFPSNVTPYCRYSPCFFKTCFLICAVKRFGSIIFNVPSMCNIQKPRFHSKHESIL